jgi:drug/metabolite transporter (DMT)-like permease
MSETTQSTKLAPNWYGLFNLLIVYIIWGSTYLAIRIGVQEGSGFPPFTLAATRVLIAGLILLSIASIRKSRIRLTWQELFSLALSGVLLWLGGNGLVSFAEQRVHSGIAALIIGSTPFDVALLESIIDRRPPSFRLILALLIGFAGIGLLSYPVFRSGVQADLVSILILLLASFLWGAGSLYQSRKPVNVDPEVSSAYQHLAGGIALALTAIVIGEPFPSPRVDALLAWGYLIIFGSVIAFTAFVRALRLLPTNVAMTYAYVNPVIAVILGWIILGEKITGWTLAGMFLILLGVAGVFQARYSKSKK